MKLFSFIILVCALSSCADYRNVIDDAVSKNVIDKSEILDFSQAWEDDSRTVSLESLVEDIKIIKLETNRESLLGGRICDVFVTQDMVYILDNYKDGSIAIFSAEGKFIKRLPQGTGRTEYSKANYMHFDTKHNKLYVLDENNHKVLTYTEKGDFLSVEYYRDMYTSVATDGADLVIGQVARGNMKREDYIIVEDYNSKAKVSWSLGKSERFYEHYPFISYDGGYLITKPYCNNVYYYKNKQLCRRYVLTSKFFDEEVLELESVNNFRQFMKKDKFYFTGKNFETKDYFISEFTSQRINGGTFFYLKPNDYTVKWTRKNRTFLDNMQILGNNSLGGNYLTGHIKSEYLQNKNYPSLDKKVQEHIYTDADMEKLKAVTPDDNPIIVLFKLKDDI